jgi:hypothetical protein
VSVDLEQSSILSQLQPHRGVRIPIDLVIICIWTLLGLGLTAFAASLGFGAEITEILSRAV